MKGQPYNLVWCLVGCAGARRIGSRAIRGRRLEGGGGDIPCLSDGRRPSHVQAICGCCEGQQEFESLSEQRPEGQTEDCDNQPSNRSALDSLIQSSSSQARLVEPSHWSTRCSLAGLEP